MSSLSMTDYAMDPAAHPETASPAGARWVRRLPPRMRRLLVCWPLLLALLLPAFAAKAHDINITGVARVILFEEAPGAYRLSVVDAQVPPLFNIERILPQRCVGLPPAAFAYRFRCEPGLNIDDSLSFPWGLAGALVIANWLEGDSVSAYVPGDGAGIEVSMGELKAGAGSLTTLAVRYLISGAEHILFGIDHLLFVLGLLLLMQGFWKLVQTVTAFTIAHSITLACAVLGVFPVPGAPVEVLIALSIAFLAREIIMGQRGETTLVHRRPWLVAFLFGLLHGFGFAGALGELGLSDADIPFALLFFNIGVELGQVGFICALLGAWYAINRFGRELLFPVERGLAYGLGAIATYWFIERLPALVIT